VVASPVQVNERVRLRLDSLAVGGEAVGRHEGMAVFVSGGCPGDEVEVDITEVSRRFARGVVREVLTASRDRVEPLCRHFGDCGGCQIQHIGYPAQLRHKGAMVRDALERIGGLKNIHVPEVWGMEKPWGYRNRAEYRAQMNDSDGVELGFARHHSHDIVSLDECRVQHPISEAIRRSIIDLTSRIARSTGEWKMLLGVETLISFASGGGIATLICDGRPSFLESLVDALSENVPNLRGVLFARRRGQSPHRSPAEILVGDGYIVEGIGDKQYRVSSDSFFQTNPIQAARVVNLVEEWADVGPDDRVLDLYSGVGTFLLPLARRARRAWGVEDSASAARDAYGNARWWGVSGVRVYERRVERFLERWVDQRRTADIVVLDPPRKGCGPLVLGRVARLEPHRIVLVSCQPATLARDLKTLADLGYAMIGIQPIDMFPQTWHVETVVVCERSDGGRAG